MFGFVRPRKGSGFRRFPRFSLPFLLLASLKGIGFRLISLFSMPFRPVTPGKGIGFRRFSRFSLPFRPVSLGKGIGFRRFPRFSLPFLLLASPKGIGFRLVSFFRCLFPNLTPTSRQPHLTKNGAPSAPRQTKLNFKPNSVSFPIFHTISSSDGSFRTVPYQRHLSSCATASCSQASKAC